MAIQKIDRTGEPVIFQETTKWTQQTRPHCVANCGNLATLEATTTLQSGIEVLQPLCTDEKCRQLVIEFMNKTRRAMGNCS